MKKEESREREREVFVNFFFLIAASSFMNVKDANFFKVNNSKMLTLDTNLYVYIYIYGKQSKEAENLYSNHEKVMMNKE